MSGDNEETLGGRSLRRMIAPEDGVAKYEYRFGVSGAEGSEWRRGNVGDSGARARGRGPGRDGCESCISVINESNVLYCVLSGGDEG